MVSIEDYFSNFMNDKGFNQRSSDQISVSKEKYDNLIEEYKLLAEEHKRIKTKNDELLKEIDDLRDDSRKLKEVEEENKEFLNSLLRVRADFDNYQKRSVRDNERYKNSVMEGMLKKLVQHYDDLNRALNMLEVIENGESMKKGFELLYKNFEKLLKDEGAEPMNCEGTKFDPYKHEAMMVEECDDLPENTIMEEIEKGYFFNNKVLRPARVKISKKPDLHNLEKNQENK